MMVLLMRTITVRRKFVVGRTLDDFEVACAVGKIHEICGIDKGEKHFPPKVCGNVDKHGIDSDDHDDEDHSADDDDAQRALKCGLC